MSYEDKGKTISLKAAADATDLKFSPVKVSTGGTFAFCAADEEAIGFLQNEVILGEAGQVMISGVTFAKANGVIAAGAKVAAAGSGKVKLTSGGFKSVGVALTSAAADGDIISVLIGAIVDADVSKMIIVTVMPASASKTAGSISGSLSVTAAANDMSTLSYQWYQAATLAGAGTAISGATSASMVIPTTLTAGLYYYYCVVSCSGAADIKTTVATITVS